TVLLTTTSPRLVCTGDDENARRVIRGTYRASFTGTSMRRTRAGTDIEYSQAAGGPAGNTEPIALRVRRSTQEVVHVRTVTEDDQGNQTCALEERPCMRSETRTFRRASNRLNIWMRPSGVRIIPSLPGGGGVVLSTCAPAIGEPAALWPAIAFTRRFPLALFNRPRAMLRFAWSGRRQGQTETGVPLVGQLVYRAGVGLVRVPGTPRATCRAC
ncbi:MAG: hypothetical protein ACRDKU_05155, partial [Gaiellaceae bacterium]